MDAVGVGRHATKTICWPVIFGGAREKRRMRRHSADDGKAVRRDHQGAVNAEMEEK